MRTLFAFIVKFYFLILFLLIETVCFILVITYNEPHNKKYVSSANYITGTLLEGYDIITQYFNLAAVNKELAEDNVSMRNRRGVLEGYQQVFAVDTLGDTTVKQRYTYLTAQVVFNTIVNQKNFLTINKGSVAGIKPDMAVISPRGVVGVVWSVSKNFATVMSVLNIDYKVSAKIKKNNYFGSLVWEGDDYTEARLLEIPFHVELKKGDTIVSSNYSNIYPAGIPIGVISEFSKTKEDNFYDIKVTLSTDFKNVEHVYVIQDILNDERDSLELALPVAK